MFLKVLSYPAVCALIIIATTFLHFAANNIGANYDDFLHSLKVSLVVSLPVCAAVLLSNVLFLGIRSSKPWTSLLSGTSALVIQILLTWLMHFAFGRNIMPEYAALYNVYKSDWWYYMLLCLADAATVALLQCGTHVAMSLCCGTHPSPRTVMALATSTGAILSIPAAVYMIELSKNFRIDLPSEITIEVPHFVVQFTFMFLINIAVALIIGAGIIKKSAKWIIATLVLYLMRGTSFLAAFIVAKTSINNSKLCSYLTFSAHFLLAWGVALAQLHSAKKVWLKTHPKLPITTTVAVHCQNGKHCQPQCQCAQLPVPAADLNPVVVSGKVLI